MVLMSLLKELDLGAATTIRRAHCTHLDTAWASTKVVPTCLRGFTASEKCLPLQTSVSLAVLMSCEKIAKVRCKMGAFTAML